MSKKVIIIGAGENGYVIANTLKKRYTIVGFLDDIKRGKDIIGHTNDYKKYIKKFYYFISIGNNQNRKIIYLKLKKDGVRFVNAIHETSFCEKNVTFGDNIFIGANCYINIRSKIGNNVFINNGCLIEHDNSIGDHSHLTPMVVTGGGVYIGEKAFIGLGAVINDHIKIGNNVTIGSGSVVVDNICSNSTAVGIPAKIIKFKKNVKGISPF
ncbi:MAG: acetyltransferase [Patescibacteria group bacterium]|nr:acetyltransferase [Patescibacteria group bacterium]MDD5715139.1 acetyltransferase [Patescibacteria group bacterium]